MEPIYRCVAGIDVHKKMLAVVVRRERDGKTEYRETEVRHDTRRDRAPGRLAAASAGRRSGDGIDGAVLAAGLVRSGRALKFNSSSICAIR